MSSLEKDRHKVDLYFLTVGRTQNVLSGEINSSDLVMGKEEFGEAMKKSLYDLTHLPGAVNIEEKVSFLQDFIKLRESGYTSVDTMA